MMTTINRQSGGALLIALIMLFMISIMGVTTMQSSSLEHRMATNAIEAKAVFQTAESATEAALNDETRLNQAIEAGINGEGIALPLTLDQNSTITGEAKLRYIGTGMVAGFSSDQYHGARFQVYGEGLRGTTAGAGIVQGAAREVPAK